MPWKKKRGGRYWYNWRRVEGQVRQEYIGGGERGRLVAAIEAIDRFDVRRPLGPWLHRISVNRAIDLVRARQLRREVAGDRVDHESSSVEVDPDEAVGLTDRMVAALGDLPIDQRAVVVMRYVLDRTPGEIARALDLPRGTVNSRLRRGLDQLAEALEEGAA